jgi:selenoprotein W-related protein
MAELLKTFEEQIEQISLVPSEGGRFELSANGELLYSKLQTHRHAEPGEAANLIRKYLKEHA